MTPAVAYVRVSTREQHLGPEAQRAAIEAWARRAGVEVVAWHEDRGVSGRRGWRKRPGLVAALDAAQAAGALLVVAKRDRLGRGLEAIMPIEEELRRRRLQLRSAAGEGTEGNASQHQLQRGILDVVSGFELALISERIKAALDVKRRQGRPYTAVPPYGWRRVETPEGPRLVDDEREQAAIAFIRAARERGRSLRWIVRAANQAGHVGRSGPMHLYLVTSILNRAQTPPRTTA